MGGGRGGAPAVGGFGFGFGKAFFVFTEASNRRSRTLEPNVPPDLAGFLVLDEAEGVRAGRVAAEPEAVGGAVIPL